jgi:hypothetical protein
VNEKEFVPPSGPISGHQYADDRIWLFRNSAKASTDRTETHALPATVTAASAVWCAMA